MRQKLSEIDEIFEKHNYDTHNIIANTFKKFKLTFAFKKYGFHKEQGFLTSEIILILLYLPLLGARSINHFYQKQFQKITTMQKDTLYRFRNNPDTDWRRILLYVAKQFDILTGTKNNSEPAQNSALIIDDSSFLKTGSHIEKVSYIFDHVLKKTVLGFKNLTLAHFDGISYKVLDFSLHAEKKLPRKHQRVQFSSNYDKKSYAFARRKECDEDKITVGIKMIKRAAKNGFKFRYVLMDSWYCTHKMLCAVRSIRQNTVHVVCAVRKDKRNYNYLGKSLNANQLLMQLKLANGKAKRNRKNNVRYYETIVDYKGIGNVRLYFAKGSRQRHWKLFLSTDTKLNFNQFVKIYSIRWGIEVIFKECKSYLKLDKCQARSFASQISTVAICYILYNILVYQKRAGHYATTGTLFEHLADDLQEKTLAEKIWSLLKDLLCLLLENISIEYETIRDYRGFIENELFKYIEQKFVMSFITPTIKLTD